ncbi:hypothetical protein FJZ33_11525, partial [Candidatus Poribacteria bacterium]|nr:hypothetical protein [Candidatus Poribacteria bacterium]
MGSLNTSRSSKLQNTLQFLENIQGELKSDLSQIPLDDESIGRIIGHIDVVIKVLRVIINKQQMRESSEYIKESKSHQAITKTTYNTGTFFTYRKDGNSSRLISTQGDESEPDIGSRAEKTNVGIIVDQQPNIKTQTDTLTEQKIDDLCKSYNMGVEDRQKRTEFFQLYHPTRFGVENVIIRRQDLNIGPIFRKSHDGDYYAIKLDGGADYSVTPRFDLTFEEAGYGPGAMG